MIGRIAAVSLVFAGGVLVAFGAMGLSLAPPAALDSRDLLVMALTGAGVVFALLGGREALRVS